MMFLRLEQLRAKLASVPAFACDAETRKALLDAINELDDAMVQETRTNHYLRTLAPESPEYANEWLALFAGSTTCGELVQ